MAAVLGSSSGAESDALAVPLLGVRDRRYLLALPVTSALLCPVSC